MGFCPNCGSQLDRESKFCPNCGTPLGAGAAQSENTNAPVGMRTVEEVQAFYKNTLQMQEKYVRQYTPGIRMLVDALMPGEVIEFATHCGIGGVQNGALAEIATTNIRFLIAADSKNAIGLDDHMKRQRRNQIESYRYDTFTDINFQNGLLYGSVKIGFIDGTITVSMDKRWTQIIYKGLSASFYQHAGGTF